MPQRGSSFLPLGEEKNEPVEDVMRGRTVTLPAPTQVVTAYGAASAYTFPTAGGTVVQGAPVDLAWGFWNTARQATVMVRTPVQTLGGNPFGIATGFGSSGVGGNVFGTYVKIQTSLGGSAKFERVFLLSPGPETRVRVFGRRVSVSAWLVAPFGAGPGECTGALAEEDVSPLGDVVAQWTPAAGLASYGNITPVSGSVQRGYFLGCLGCLSGGGAGTNYWLMVFDRAPGTAAVPGDVPLVALGPLIGGQGTPFAFDRSLRPSVRFAAGLTWAISAAPDLYAAPSGSPLVRLDSDYGV